MQVPINRPIELRSGKNTFIRAYPMSPPAIPLRKSIVKADRYATFVGTRFSISFSSIESGFSVFSIFTMVLM